jgi:tetratricopeptide (TPR) repeat protein
MRRRIVVLVLTLGVMAAWAGAYRAVSSLDSGFFYPTRTGLRGLALYLRGDYAGAARAYREARRSWMEIPYADDPFGETALYRGDLETAERRAETTLTFIPMALEPLLTLGEIALERAEPARAQAYFGVVLNRQPDHVDALLLSAVAQSRLGDHGKAIRAMNRALRHNSAGTRSLLLFHALEVVGDLGRQPQPPLCLLAHYHRYLRIFDERQGELALEYGQRAVATGDRPADAWLTVGIILDKRGRHAQALHAFQQAIAADPTHAEAYRWAGVQASRLRDPLLEYRMVQAALEAAPADGFYVRPAERVVMRWFGDARTMSTLLHRALERNPSNIAAHEAQARAVAQLGEADRAATHTRQAAELRRRRETQ